MTQLSEPSFVDQGGAHDVTPGGPMAGSAVPPTMNEDDPGAGYAAPPPQAGYTQQPGYAQQPFNGPSAYGPSAGYGPSGPGSMVAPPAPTRKGRGRSQGPSLVLIGAIAFVVIGGVTTVLALRGRSTSDDDKPTPTVNVPTPVNVPADTGTVPSEPPPV